MNGVLRETKCTGGFLRESGGRVAIPEAIQASAATLFARDLEIGHGSYL